MGLTLGGLGVGVAQSGNGDPAEWVEFTETYVLDADFASEVFLLPDGTEPPPPAEGEEEEIPPPGSKFFFSEDIYESIGGTFKKGELIGESDGKCEVGVAATLCQVSATFHGKGTVELLFSFRFDAPEAETETVAIVGGTGHFWGIQGEAVLYDETDANDPTDEIQRVVFDTVMPVRH
jgi:hypothetical protein